MTPTLDQQIAEAAAKTGPAAQPTPALENGQKIILGGMLLAAARHDPKIRSWVTKAADKAVTRDIDRKRLPPLLEELKAMGDAKEMAVGGNGQG